jgi:hypothetical protein
VVSLFGHDNKRREREREREGIFYRINYKDNRFERGLWKGKGVRNEARKMEKLLEAGRQCRRK